MDIISKAKQEEIWRRANPALRPFEESPARAEAPEKPRNPTAGTEPTVWGELRILWRHWVMWRELSRRCPGQYRHQARRHTEELYAKVQPLAEQHRRVFGRPPRFAAPAAVGEYRRLAAELLKQEDSLPCPDSGRKAFLRRLVS
ncbi:MAG: hypothetical protein IJP23_05795 [Oscillospiraceae bacterium]|nr:hypothetical protein [Oscillospiraceae bacterium]